MGEPIRIADLARNMITLSGLVPDEDVSIVYTGLRPGEKLNEELLTQDEDERSHVVRNRIRVTHGLSPPADLRELLADLRRLCDAGDRDGVRDVLRALVPTYQVTPNGARHEPMTSPVAVAAAPAPGLPGTLLPAMQ
jgi:FlaA1/EpsC-like NDP-sugar epimerase